LGGFDDGLSGLLEISDPWLGVDTLLFKKTVSVSSIDSS
jgi:hypothetical protein